MAIFTSTTDLWNSVILSVEKSHNKHIVDSWFRPVQVEAYDADSRKICLRAGQVTKDWVELYYTDLLKKTLDDLGYRDHVIEWSVDESENEEDRFKNDPEDEYSYRPEVQGSAAAQDQARSAAAGSVRQAEVGPVDN